MSGLKRTTEKNLMLFSGRAHPRLADEVAHLLETTLVRPRTATSRTPRSTSATRSRCAAATRSSLQSHTAPINEWIMEHLLMVDALKRASAKRITVVMPFYGYARQDKKHLGREPISARLIADLFKTAGRGPADHRRPAHGADPGLLRRARRPSRRAAGARRSTSRAATPTRTSPWSPPTPAGSRWPSSGPSRLGGVPLAFIHKSRDITQSNESVAQPRRR